jgi:hypothetical protein
MRTPCAGSTLVRCILLDLRLVQLTQMSALVAVLLLVAALVVAGLLFYQECQWCNAESREKTVGDPYLDHSRMCKIS